LKSINFSLNDNLLTQVRLDSLKKFNTKNN